jgi:hypothetical protein
MAPTMNQTPKKWYVQGNWFDNVQHPINVVGPNGGLVPGQQIVYLSKFLGHHGGLVEEVIA